jgi:hypothetical protein
VTAAAKDLKDLILAAEDIDFEDMDVPEWGVKVRVRGMSGTDRDSFEAKMVAVRKGGAAGQEVELRLADFRSKVLVKCLVDPETQKRIFDDKDAQQLGLKSGAVIDRLFDVAKRLSGMDEAAEEDARGNSGTGPSAGSTTD